MSDDDNRKSSTNGRTSRSVAVKVEEAATAAATEESSNNVQAQHDTDADATHNFELIDEVEWGKRKGEDGYDTDQSLAARPRRISKSIYDDDHHERERCDCLERYQFCSDESCLFFASREECAKRCGLNDQCRNQRLTKKQFAHVEHFDAGIKGRGLRLSPNAPQAATKGQLLCEYTGRAIRESKLQKLFRRYQHDRRLYIMSLGDGVYIDARQKGGVARYINHSCRPNCKVELWTVKGIRRAAVVVLDQPIQPGDELTFDYQWERKRGRAPTVCHCGMPECRGTLEMSITNEELELQQELEGHWEEYGDATTSTGTTAASSSSKRKVKDGSTLVNRTVRIYSHENNTYFLGEVTGYDRSKGLHHIYYPHDKSEEWEDLSKEKWMVLNEKVDIDLYNIARKSCSSAIKTTQLTRDASAALVAAAAGDGHAKKAQKNYLYVQTHVKDKLGKTMEIVQRNCCVQIDMQQMARPPLPSDGTEEDDEKYAALDKSLDGTVWRLTITGEKIGEAHDALVEKAKKFMDESFNGTGGSSAAAGGSKTPPPSFGTATTVRSFDAPGPPSITDVHEVVFPRLVADAVKRKLPAIRDACRNVTLIAVPTESKSKQIGKIVLEGNLLSDIETAKANLWLLLNGLCQECNAPKKAGNEVYRDLGFLGGALSQEQFQLLFVGDTTRSTSDPTTTAATTQPPPAKRPRLDGMNSSANGDATYSPFIQAFERINGCSVWVQVLDDRGHSSSNRSLQEGAASTAPLDTSTVRTIYFGCQPSEVLRLATSLQERARDMARGVLYVSPAATDSALVPNWKQLGQDVSFFEFVKTVTGASSIEVDPMTDHLRIDGKLGGVQRLKALDARVLGMTDAERALLANEIIRLQLECYRDASIRRSSSWCFGRDWIEAVESTLSSGTESSPTNGAMLSMVSALERGSACQCGMPIAETVARLGLPASVGGHAMVILYRFVHAKPTFSTKITIREAILACIFLANKSQKMRKWKSLELVIEAGYEIFYKGAAIDNTSVEAKVLAENTLQAEKEILAAVQYDIFWSDCQWIYTVATGDGMTSPSRTDAVLQATFSGPVLGAGAELWLNYGVEYIFAVVAGFLESQKEDVYIVDDPKKRKDKNGRDDKKHKKSKHDRREKGSRTRRESENNENESGGKDDDEPKKVKELDTLPTALSLDAVKLSQTAHRLKNLARYAVPASTGTPTNGLFEQSGRLDKCIDFVLSQCKQMLGRKTQLDIQPELQTAPENQLKLVGDQSRLSFVVRGISSETAMQHILPRIDSIIAESSCRINFTAGESSDLCNVVFSGTWRAIAVASHLVKSGGVVAQQSFVVRGISCEAVKQQVLPRIDHMSAESSCRMSVTAGASGNLRNVVLNGTCSAIAVALRLVESCGVAAAEKQLADALDESFALERRDETSNQAKALPGLFRSEDVMTGWNGSMPSSNGSSSTSRPMGGKYCSAGRVSDAPLKRAGLRWWVPPEYGANDSGSILDLYRMGEVGLNRLDLLIDVAGHVALDKNNFPMLLDRASDKDMKHASVERFIPVSFQQWPNEKAASKEKGKMSESDQIGFSASALQEMQALKQLHCTIPSPMGHPNFVLPVGIALPDAENDPAAPKPTEDDDDNELYDNDAYGASSQDTYNLLFQSNKALQDVASSNVGQTSAVYILPPTPFTLQRFLSRKGASAEAGIDAILPAWFHDILSALVHCHTNGILLGAVSADLVFVDHCGTVKFGGMHKWKSLGNMGKQRSADPLAAAKAKAKASKKKKEKDDFSPTDLYTAPEMLLGCPNHSKETDVFSVGCLLAHLLTQKPLFKGKERESRLLSQFKIVGAPKKENFGQGREYPYYVKPEFKWKERTKSCLRKILNEPEPEPEPKPEASIEADDMLDDNAPPTAPIEVDDMLDDTVAPATDEPLSLNEKAIRLVSKMVRLDPDRRWTAEKALQCAFMVEYETNCKTPAFRNQFVAEWMALKQQVLQKTGRSSHESSAMDITDNTAATADDVDDEQAAARKRALAAAEASAADNADSGDDLYDMADLMPDATTKRQRTA